MDQALFDHLFALAAKTGDRMIVVDPATRQPFVVMPVAQYEALVLRNYSTSGTNRFSVPDIAAQTMPISSVPPVMEGIDLGAIARESERMEASTGVAAFIPEPTTAALPDDERFYVEPLE